MSVLERLAALSRAFARRRALVLGLTALTTLGVVAAVAAAFAELGWLAQARWAPLALWLGGIVLLVFAARAIARTLGSTDARVLRDTASLVERERSLRRGAFVGLVDLSRGTSSGTSPELAKGAASRVAMRLAEGEWAPAHSAMLSRRVRMAAAAALGAIAVAAVSFAFAGEAAATLVSPLRALRAAVHPKIRISLSKVSVSPGESVTVTAEAEPAGRPVLYVRRTGESWRPVRLDADARGLATHVLADVRAATFVFASSDGRVSDTLQVRVVQPVVLGDFAVRARFPAYLERPDEDLDPAAGPLALPVGTVLQLRGTASAPLVSAAFVAAADTARLRVTPAGFDGELTVRASATWHMRARDPSGAALAEPLPVLDIRAVLDSAPVVLVPVPGADTTMPLDLRAQVVVDARDDHGLARAEIVSWRVSRLGVASDSEVDSLPGVAGADRIVQSQVLDATRRGLNPGDTLRFFVRAEDRAPSPHTGRSREFALRLRSMAELREAVRAGTDTLTHAAASLAADQSALARQTQDLAAQRNRAQDRTARAADPRQTGNDRAHESNTGTEQFEQNAQAQRLMEEQQALLQRADSMRGELERLMRAADQAGINDPQWQQRLKELDDLLRQAMTPQLQRELEALQQALQRLDPRAVQDALRRLVDRQQELRDQLQRSAELFERAALEGSMQTFAQNAEQLGRDQQEWADRAPQRADSAAASTEERQLRQATDSLRSQLAQLQQRLQQRGDSTSERALEQTGEHADSAQQSMQQAAQSMQSGQRQPASRQGSRAAQQLQQTAQQLHDTQQQMSAGWRQEVQRALEESTQEAVQLASEEQRLSQSLRRGEGARDARARQSAMEQGINQVTRRLEGAAGKNALVSPRLGAMMSQARQQVAASREALEGPSPSVDESADHASQAAQSLAAAAVQMMRNASEVGGAESGSGYQEAMQRLAQLAGQQGQLNDQLGSLLPMLGAGQDAVMQQLRQLAERQRGLANQLERIGETGVGDPRQLADEARQLADRIEQARLDRTTLERQQRLFRRMLDAGRSLRNDEEPDDPERKSRTAQDMPARPEPANTARATALRYPVPAWAELRQLAPSERAMVLDYFRRLN
ncbi:MAG: hypothetical protein ACHQU1_09065, partial [Gemmatimonadales bacterium]